MAKYLGTYYVLQATEHPWRCLSQVDRCFEVKRWSLHPSSLRHYPSTALMTRLWPYLQSMEFKSDLLLSQIIFLQGVNGALLVGKRACQSAVVRGTAAGDLRYIETPLRNITPSPYEKKKGTEQQHKITSIPCWRACIYVYVHMI